MDQKLAYIVSRFPHLPETFILREMVEMENLGWSITLYPLIVQKQAVVHPDALKWVKRARYLSFISLHVLIENVVVLAHNPVEYFTIWKQIVCENLTDPNLLVRALVLFPKVVGMAKQMQKDGINHIHAHYATHPTLAAWIIHRLTGISYSITVHAHDIFVHKAMLETKMREAVFIIAISEFNREFIAREVGPWVKAKTYVIHCGILPENYPVMDNTWDSKNDQKPFHKPLSPSGDYIKTNSDGKLNFRIFSIGSLQPYKGQQYLIRACKILVDQGVPLYCCIIGGGILLPKLKRMIKENNMDDAVELLGPKTQEEVAMLLQTADCYVQPSIITPNGKMDGIPVSLMEALACEVPVIATSISGIPELVRHGETGFLVKPADSTALAEMVATIYHNADHAKQTARIGRELVLKEYNLHINVSQLSSLLHEVIKKE